MGGRSKLKTTTFTTHEVIRSFWFFDSVSAPTVIRLRFPKFANFIFEFFFQKIAMTSSSYSSTSC